MPVSTSTVERPRPRAVLVGIQLPGLTEAQVEASLDELHRLCDTLGIEPIARLTQRRRGLGAPTVLGVGKLRELARLTGGDGIVPSSVPAWRRKGTADVNPADDPDADDDSANLEADDREADGFDADDLDADGFESDDSEDDATVAVPGEAEATVVVFDHDLSPGQLRNLEGATGAEVLDRSSVILHIFQRHARTREARLQVEIAQLKYLAPRLRATAGKVGRQQGGIGGRGGPGEQASELERRRVATRIIEAERELEHVARESQGRRDRRSEMRVVALVGYTNAGKSTLMRALTGADVLVEDRLFATLDTTVRSLHPAAGPRVLVSDTVGFIDRLPHDLVASFRSTLAEAREADLLLHVVDGADPAFRDQLRVTHEVLGEIEAGDRPSLLVLNKADRLDIDASARLLREFPEAILVSAFDPDRVAALRARIVEFLERSMEDAELFVPYVAHRLMHEIHEAARVLSEVHEDDGTRLTVRAPATVIAKLKAATRATSVN